MSAKKAKPSMTARRKVIAAEKIKGRTLTAVAAELGVTRETASHDFNAQETKNYIRELLGKHDAEIAALITKSLAALDATLSAEKKDTADHFNRMRAVAETSRLLGLRAGRNDDGNGSGIARNFSGTMEELLVLYRRVTTAEEPEG